MTTSISRYYRLKGARINPKPLQQPYPAIVNAGMSGAGRDFGAKHADFTFVNLKDIDELKAAIADIREAARTKYGREIGMLNHAYVVARDTEKEAIDYERYFIDECGDWAATDAYVESFTRSGSQSQSIDRLRTAKRGLIAGFNAVPLIGTPEQVVEKMIAISKAGINGTALHWVDYEAGIDYFNRRVLPLMIQAGLRRH